MYNMIIWNNIDIKNTLKDIIPLFSYYYLCKYTLICIRPQLTNSISVNNLILYFVLFNNTKPLIEYIYSNVFRDI